MSNFHNDIKGILDGLDGYAGFEVSYEYADDPAPMHESGEFLICVYWNDPEHDGCCGGGGYAVNFEIHKDETLSLSGNVFSLSQLRDTIIECIDECDWRDDEDYHK